MALYGNPQATFTIDAHNEDLTNGASVQWPSTSGGTAFPYAQIGTTPVMGLPCNPGDQIIISLNDPADTDFTTQVAATAGEQSGTYLTYTSVTAPGTDAAAETTAAKTTTNEVFGPPGTNPTLTAAGTDPDAGTVITLAFGAGLSASNTVVDAAGTPINATGLIGAAGATDNSTRGAFMVDGTHYAYFDGPYASIPNTVDLDSSGFENIEVFATIGEVRDPHTGMFPIYLSSGQSGIHGGDVHHNAIGKGHKHYGNWETGVIINGSFSTIKNNNTSPGTDLVLTKSNSAGTNNPQYIPDGALPGSVTSVSLTPGTVISNYSTLVAGGSAWPAADPSGAAGAYVLLDLTNPSSPVWATAPANTDLTVDSHIKHVKLGAMSTNTDPNGTYIFHPTVAGASGLSSVGYSNPNPLGDKTVLREYDYPHKPHSYQIDGAYVTFNKSTSDGIQYTYYKTVNGTSTSSIEPNSGWYDTLSLIAYTDSGNAETPAIAQFTSSKNYTVTNFSNLSCKAKPDYFVVVNVGGAGIALSNNMTADQALVSGPPGSGTNPTTYTMAVGEIRCLYYHPSETHKDLVVIGRISKTRDSNGYLYIRGWHHNNTANYDDLKPNSFTVESDEPKKPHKWVFDNFHLTFSTANATYSDFTTINMVVDSGTTPNISFVDNNATISLTNTSFTAEANYYIYFNATGAAISLPVGTTAPATAGGVAGPASIAAGAMAAVSQRPLDPTTGKIPKGLWTVGKMSPTADSAGYLFMVGWHHGHAPISPDKHIPDQAMSGGTSPDGSPGKLMDNTVSVENDEPKKPHKWLFENFSLIFDQAATTSPYLSTVHIRNDSGVSGTDGGGTIRILDSDTVFTVANATFPTSANYYIYFNATGSTITLPQGTASISGTNTIAAYTMDSVNTQPKLSNGKIPKGLWTVGRTSPYRDSGGFLFIRGWHHSHMQIPVHTIPTSGIITTGAGGLQVPTQSVTGGSGGYLASNTVTGSAGGAAYSNFSGGTVGTNDVGDSEMTVEKDEPKKAHKWVFQNFVLIFTESVNSGAPYATTVYLRNDGNASGTGTDPTADYIEMTDTGATFAVANKSFGTQASQWIYFNSTGGQVNLPIIGGVQVTTHEGLAYLLSYEIRSVTQKPIDPSTNKVTKGLWTVGHVSPYCDLSGFLFLRGWHHGHAQIASHTIPIGGPIVQAGGGLNIGAGTIQGSHLNSNVAGGVLSLSGNQIVAKLGNGIGNTSGNLTLRTGNGVGFDSNGNTAIKLGAKSNAVTMLFDSSGNIVGQLTFGNGTTVDANGNLTLRTGNGVGFDSNGNTAVKLGSKSNAVTMLFDGSGNIVGQLTFGNGTTVDGNGNLTLITNSAGAIRLDNNGVAVNITSSNPLSVYANALQLNSNSVTTAYMQEYTNNTSYYGPTGNNVLYFIGSYSATILGENEWVPYGSNTNTNVASSFSNIQVTAPAISGDAALYFTLSSNATSYTGEGPMTAMKMWGSGNAPTVNNGSTDSMAYSMAAHDAGAAVMFLPRHCTPSFTSGVFDLGFYNFYSVAATINFTLNFYSASAIA